MALDQLIGSQRLLKFSPTINLETFRYNSIYVNNLLKINIPCTDEESLYNKFGEKNDIEDKIQIEVLSDNSEDEGNEIEKGRLEDDVDKERNVWWRKKKVGQAYNELINSRRLVSRLFYQNPNYINTIKTETKYIGRSKPNFQFDILSLNRKDTATIDEDSFSKYKNGFLNYIQSLDGSLEDAKHAVITVNDFTFECIQKNPDFSKLNLFAKVSTDCYDNVTTKISSNRFTICRDPNTKVAQLVKCKYYHFYEYAFETRTNIIDEEIPKDFRITVRLLMPKVPKLKRIPCNSNIWRPVIDKIYYLRGENYLIELRNKIACHWDFVCTKKAEDGQPTEDDFLISQLPSSFLFIHDTLYIDLTRKNSKDITSVYIEFFKKRSHIFGSVKVKDINNNKISDLNIRLGHPYVFVHMGGHCEHQFVFSDLRMLTINDYYHIETYPFKVAEVYRGKLCNVCKLNVPNFVVISSQAIPKCPKLLCYTCYHRFHFVLDVKSIDSEAYHYIDKNGFV
ncbi:snRNA-activating protein complex subunit 3 [Strongyloides ratti]|uniref:snRNA-activating protein complex subunit 3 n=1 Tax=Strongyloides ratti TaxID=34506 RepID=A0A090L5X9_STRRB|nr:snRNA-activating protein complex subunit 3 [Strongyloides ratti]CEF65122.1 snRNA-activating protein complex subunit 3 [Strongyloides ratti]